MPRLQIRRISLDDPQASTSLQCLQERLSPRGDVVSPRGRALTEQLFGEPLPPARVVERICEQVRCNGLAAVLHFTEQLDQVKLTPATIRVSDAELSQAHRTAEPGFLETIRRVRQNILSFQAGLIHRDACMQVTGLHELRLRYRPLRRVGVCIPGGAAAYPSTLLMTVCPAQAAGVREIAVVVPPTPFGGYNSDILATCQELGVAEVYRIGGAQAVAALAYGIEGIPQVDMIVGPGNQFVSLAKRHVYGTVAIDSLAGPSEVVLLADESAVPAFVASDLISQAEHSPGASILVTWSEPLIEAVHQELERQLAVLPRGELARDSLEQFGALVLARSADEAVACANRLAPEHLHLSMRDPELLLGKIENAGAIFLGHYAPVAVGDYVAGPSHVLPTGGTARFASGLSANDFLKRSSVISFTPDGLKAVANDIKLLAEKEGLMGHWASVRVRLDSPFPAPAPRLT